MLKKNSQAGSALIVIVLVIALIGVLGFVVWKNLSKEKPVDNTANDSQTTHSKEENGKPVDPYAGWKTYKTITSSGFSFKYPPEWEFTPPAKEFVNNSGGKMNELTLYSKKPKVVPKNGAPVTTNQFMCVSFTEFAGTWRDSKNAYEDELKSERFSVAGKSIFLNTYSDITRDNRPMGNTMRLISNPPSRYGQSYIDTSNGYRVQATARYNCMQGGEGIKDLDADFYTQPDTITAKLIMKSIRF